MLIAGVTEAEPCASEVRFLKVTLNQSGAAYSDISRERDGRYFASRLMVKVYISGIIGLRRTGTGNEEGPILELKIA